MGKSDSYISQVENGRMAPPFGDALDRFLAAVGGLNSKSFYERVRRFRIDRGRTERDELLEVAKRATEIQVMQILLLAKTINPRWRTVSMTLAFEKNRDSKFADCFYNYLLFS